MMEKSEESVTVGVEYWLKWQVAVCALIFIIPSVVSLILIVTRSQREPSIPISSTNLWLPCWRNLNPLCLLLYRAFAFASMAFLLYQTVLAFGFFVFYFYTQYDNYSLYKFGYNYYSVMFISFYTLISRWTFALVMVYFAVCPTLKFHISDFSFFFCMPRPKNKR